MLRETVTFACFALASLACRGAEPSPPPQPAATPVASPTAAASPSGTAAGAEAMIRGIYAPYLAGGELPDLIADDRDTLQRTFADALTDLLLADFACQKREDGICKLDWDPFIAAQDWQIEGLAVSAPDVAEQGRATVRVSFRNGGEPTEVVYSLVELPRGWRIADVEYPPGGPDRPSLKTTLSAPAP